MTTTQAHIVDVWGERSDLTTQHVRLDAADYLRVPADSLVPDAWMPNGRPAPERSWRSAVAAVNLAATYVAWAWEKQGYRTRTRTTPGTGDER